MLLASLLSILCVSVSWTAITKRTSEFYAALLITETAMLGLFSATNLFCFFVFILGRFSIVRRFVLGDLFCILVLDRGLSDSLVVFGQLLQQAEGIQGEVQGRRIDPIVVAVLRWIRVLVPNRLGRRAL